MSKEPTPITQKIHSVEKRHNHIRVTAEEFLNFLRDRGIDIPDKAIINSGAGVSLKAYGITYRGSIDLPIQRIDIHWTVDVKNQQAEIEV